MKDEGKQEFDRRVRLGLTPARNPFIGQVTVYSNQQHELLKADNAKIPHLIAARDRLDARRHLQNSQSRQDEINRLKLKERRTAQIKQFFEKQKTTRDDSARRSKEIIMRKAAQREEKFVEMVSSAIGGSVPIRSIEQYLDKKDATETEKSRRLCQAWNELVYKKIQNQIIQNVNDEKTSKRISVRNELYLQYLKASGKGRGVFLDLIRPEKYDPFKWTEFDTRYSVKTIRDPVKRDLRKHAVEAKGVFRLNN